LLAGARKFGALGGEGSGISPLEFEIAKKRLQQTHRNHVRSKQGTLRPRLFTSSQAENAANERDQLVQLDHELELEKMKEERADETRAGFHTIPADVRHIVNNP